MYFCNVFNIVFDMIKINASRNVPELSSLVLLATAESDFENCGLSDDEIHYVKTQIEVKSERIAVNKAGRWIFVQPVDCASASSKADADREKMRRDAYKLHQFVVQQKIRSLAVVDLVKRAFLSFAFAEGMALSNYQFLNYSGKKSEKEHSLSELIIVSDIDEMYINRLIFVTEAVYKARDLVNEPPNVLTPAALAAEFVTMGKNAGLEVTVFDKAEIEKMNMGGILSVNMGSIEEPTFTVLEWKPDNAKNGRPIVLVGKGLTYDTGGHNLKTGNYMDDMKSDMAGGAAVAAVVYAAAKTQLPIHVVALVPATDNRISANAISPGDIITISGGTTVEVVNTDAEGRLILADALVFANKYDPELVISVATLTGSAQRAVGNRGMAGMGNAPRKTMELLKECGEIIHERIVEFPLWDDYAEELKSDFADLKNVGSEYAGMTTAGKFLEHFTSYPFIHLDIAGAAYAKEAKCYRGKGATGVGVRLLLKFLIELHNE